MADIESPLGTISSNERSNMRRYVVDEPDMGDEPIRNPHYKPQPKQEIQNRTEEQSYIKKNNFNEEENRVYTEIQNAKRAQKLISPESKRKLEMLLGLKQTKKTCVIDGMRLTLKNLNSSDMKLFFQLISSKVQNQIDLMFYNRNISVALSLYEIDGQKFSDLLNESDDEIDIEARLSVIEEMSEEVVREIYEFYEKEIGISLPTTEKEIKEVTSEIKK